MALPGRIRNPLRLLFTLFGVESQLCLRQHHRRARFIRSLIVDIATPADTKPEDHAVFSLLQIGGNVVGLIEGPLAQIRYTRAQHLIAHPHAVNVELVITAGSNIHQSAGGELLKLIGLAYPGVRHAWLRIGHIFTRSKNLIRPNPFGIPIFFAHRSHAPKGRLAPPAPVAVLVCHPYPPPAVHRIAQCLTLIFYLGGL